MRMASLHLGEAGLLGERLAEPYELAALAAAFHVSGRAG